MGHKAKRPRPLPRLHPKSGPPDFGKHKSGEVGYIRLRLESRRGGRPLAPSSRREPPPRPPPQERERERRHRCKEEKCPPSRSIRPTPSSPPSSRAAPSSTA